MATVLAALGVITAVVFGILSLPGCHKEDKPLSTVSGTIGAQNATASGAGPATNNAVIGQGSAAGNSKINSDNPVSPNSSTVGANSPGAQPFAVYAAPGSTVNFFVSSPVPLSNFVATQKKRAAKSYNVGTHELKAGLYKTAVTNLKFATDYLPNFAQAHNNYALALFHLTQRDLALTEMKKAIGLAPGNKMYYFNYTSIYVQGEVAVASLNLDPKNFNDLGFFAVINQSNSKLYNVIVRSELIEGNLPLAHWSDQSTTTLTLFPSGDVLVYRSKLAGVLADSPEKVKQIRTVVIYSLSSTLPALSQTFYFVARQDNTGHWDWYPKL